VIKKYLNLYDELIKERKLKVEMREEEEWWNKENSMITA